MEKMPGHPRLYRRGAVYYHRAAIPVDIKDTYPKAEETFSLGTKDYNEALKRVRIAAVEIDRRFDQHRHKLQQQASAPILDELTEFQIKQLGRCKWRSKSETILVAVENRDTLIQFSSGVLVRWRPWWLPGQDSLEERKGCTRTWINGPGSDLSCAMARRASAS
ncbi:DUF6538 domain-containing protein [Desulfoferula mesophila]